ncbi:3974_t:CDS:1, partial [Gigaspora rosea]
TTKRKQLTRWIFLYEEATKEDWQNYAEDLNLFLKRKLESSKGAKNCRAKLSLNKLWDIFQQSIISAANKNLPKKKILMREAQNLGSSLKQISGMQQQDLAKQ